MSYRISFFQIANVKLRKPDIQIFRHAAYARDLAAGVIDYNQWQIIVNGILGMILIGNAVVRHDAYVAGAFLQHFENICRRTGAHAKL